MRQGRGVSGKLTLRQRVGWAGRGCFKRVRWWSSASQMWTVNGCAPRGQDAYLLWLLLWGAVAWVFGSSTVLGLSFLKQNCHGFHGCILLGHFLAASFSWGKLSATDDNLEFKSWWKVIRCVNTSLGHPFCPLQRDLHPGISCYAKGPADLWRRRRAAQGTPVPWQAQPTPTFLETKQPVTLSLQAH